jgi:DNA modification methylase
LSFLPDRKFQVGIVGEITLIKFLQGNCIDKIKELEDNSIDCVVSSPPYFGLRNYGVDGQFGLEKTYQDYIANTLKVFETFKPKLKDTATIWWNVGDSYSSGSRKTTTLQTVRKPKSNEISKSKHKYLDGLIVRPAIQTGIKEKDLLMIPNRVAIALQDAGWYIRSEIIWHKPNPMPESVRDRPTSAHEKIWLITKNKKYYYNADAIREPCTESTKQRYKSGWNGNEKRDYVSGKQNHFSKYIGTEKSKQDALKGRNKRNVWTITTKPCKEAHFATFPKDLIEPCIKAGCPENGIVLDPFGGSGTTGIVAKSLNRKSIMIELNPEYIKIAKKRIEKELGLFG